MTNNRTATARAHPNIAFIKYWGNRNEQLRLPANPSLSMNLDELHTQTTVTWYSDLPSDQLILNNIPQTGATLNRVSDHLDKLRQRLGISAHARVESSNNFPMGAGIASSASSFAALTVAAIAAAKIVISEREMTTLARLGSGSAARSIPDGFVKWYAGQHHEESFAESIAPAHYWDLVDVLAIISHAHKAVGSQEGHRTAQTSDLQAARVAGADNRLAICERALLERDFPTFAEIVEHDSNLMHAVMMTSRPPLFYWLPGTLTVMEHVRRWRAEGLQVCYTLDAGPNVHCICIKNDAEQVRAALATLSEVLDIRTAIPGGPAYLMDK